MSFSARGGLRSASERGHLAPQTSNRFESPLAIAPPGGLGGTAGDGLLPHIEVSVTVIELVQDEHGPAMAVAKLRCCFLGLRDHETHRLPKYCSTNRSMSMRWPAESNTRYRRDIVMGNLNQPVSAATVNLDSAYLPAFEAGNVRVTPCADVIEASERFQSDGCAVVIVQDLGQTSLCAISEKVVPRIGARATVVLSPLGTTFVPGLFVIDATISPAALVRLIRRLAGYPSPDSTSPCDTIIERGGGRDITGSAIGIARSA